MDKNQEAPEQKVLWPVNDMGDNVSYLDNLPDEDCTTPEFRAKQIALGNRRPPGWTEDSE